MNLDPFFRQLRLAAIVGSVLTLVPVGLAAADPGKGPDTARIEQVAERLQLSEGQKQPFRETMLAFRSNVLATLDRHGVDPDAGQRPSLAVMFRLRSDMKRNRAELEDRLATILTPEQMRKFSRIQEERRAAGFPGLKQ